MAFIFSLDTIIFYNNQLKNVLFKFAKNIKFYTIK